MRLGKEQATGFVRDDEAAAVTGHTEPAPEQAREQEPAAPPLAVPQEEPAGLR